MELYLLLLELDRTLLESCNLSLSAAEEVRQPVEYTLVEILVLYYSPITAV